ncbi:hypothetical protein D3C78_1856100 [compost metagenome]
MSFAGDHDDAGRGRFLEVFEQQLHQQEVANVTGTECQLESGSCQPALAGQTGIAYQ